MFANGIRLVRGALINFTVILLTACGGSGSSSTMYSVGGVVQGLAGSGLILELNGASDPAVVSDFAIASDGSFSFPSTLADGTVYAVDVKQQPRTPTQVCNVAKGHGTVRGGAVSDVTVNCYAQSFSVGGSVSGLKGSGFALQLNSNAALPIQSDGSFTFPTAVGSGSAYVVGIATQPSKGSCSLSNASGTVMDGDVTNIIVTCVYVPYTLHMSDVAVNDVAWDPHSNQLYLAMSSLSPVAPNSIVAFDPVTGTLGASVYAGSEPYSVSVSDDGQFIYVGFSGEQAARRFKLPALTLDISISTVVFQGNDALHSGEPTFATQVYAAPHAPRTYALMSVSQVSPASPGSIAVYDDAVLRGPFFLNPVNPRGYALQWSGTADTLYTSIGTGGGGPIGFQEFQFPVQGAPFLIGQFLGLPSSQLTFNYAGGVLYTDSGQAIDASSGAYIGTYTGTPATATGTAMSFASVPDVAHDRFFLCNGDNSGAVTLQSFDRTSFTLLESALIMGGAVAPLKLVRWGGDGLALILRDRRLIILSGSMVASGGPTVVGTMPATGEAPPVITPTQAKSPVTATDIAWDTAHSSLYATVSANAAVHPKSIAEINPGTGEVLRYVDLPFTPGTLGISSDGQYLYVVSLDDATIRRLTLPQMASDLTIPLGTFGTDGVISEISVAPDAPHTILVSRKGGTVATFFAIFDDAASRASADNLPGSRGQWGDTSAKVFTFDSYYGSFDLRAYDVSATAVSLTDATPSALNARFVNPLGTTFAYAGGRVYGQTGEIWDVATRGIVGTLMVPVPAPLTVDVAHKRAIYAVGTQLQSFDTEHYKPVVMATIYSDYGANRIVQTGATSFAVVNAGGQVIVVNDARLGR